MAALPILATAGTPTFPQKGTPVGEGDASHIGEKIKRLRSFRGMTCSELADAIGCTRPYLSAVENGRYPASTKILRKLQQALDVTSDYFANADKPSLDDTGRFTTTRIHSDTSGGVATKTASAGTLTRVIPFVALSASGEPSHDFDEYPSGDTDTIDCPGDIEDQQAFAVRVDGDEMAPVIPPGSMAFVSPNKPVKDSHPVLIRLNTGEVLCRLYQAKSGQVILAPYNLARPVRLVDATDVDWIYPVVKVMIDLYSDPPAIGG